LINDIFLNEVEVRVLGALLEKNYTTPEYYPLSLNSLINACNQKSNRHPVVSFDEQTTLRGVEGLKKKKFAVQSDSGRVVKYAENFVSSLNLITKEAALLAVLFLRGPQTLGELRGRSERIYIFQDVNEVANVLDNLAESGFVTQLPKQQGRKENRYIHMFSGEAELSENTSPEHASVHMPEMHSDRERIEKLEKQVADIQAQLEDIRAQFMLFKSEFE
jgi:hypothetical protein